MLIQNVNNTVSTPVGLASGGPAVVAPAPSRAEVSQPVVQPLSPAQLSQEVSRINSALKQANRNVELSISVDESTKKQIVKLTDKETGDTILQYPSEAVLAISRGIDEFQQNLMLKQKA